MTEIKELLSGAKFGQDIKATVSWVGEPFKEGTMQNVKFDDGTGIIEHTLWNENVGSLVVGDQISIAKCYTDEWKGKKQLKLSRTATPLQKMGHVEYTPQPEAQVVLGPVNAASIAPVDLPGVDELLEVFLEVLTKVDDASKKYRADTGNPMIWTDTVCADIALTICKDKKWKI